MSKARNVAIEYRWAEGHDNRLPALAAELVRLRPDLIVTTGTPGTLAAKRASSTIPIVFASSGNPVNCGLFASFSRPGGNVTGFTISGPELSEGGGCRAFPRCGDMELIQPWPPGLLSTDASSRCGLEVDTAAGGRGSQHQ